MLVSFLRPCDPPAMMHSLEVFFEVVEGVVHAVFYVWRRRRLLARFEERSATGAHSAIQRECVAGAGDRVFEKLVRRGVLVRGAEGGFYLDQNAAERDAKRELRNGLVLVGVLVVLAGVGVAWGIDWKREGGGTGS